MASSTVPKVVFIIGDNVGWGDIGCYGGFDLIDDPNEEWDLIEKRLDGARVVGPVPQRLAELQQSMSRYRNVTPGEEFTGYA